MKFSKLEIKNSRSLIKLIVKRSQNVDNAGNIDQRQLTTLLIISCDVELEYSSFRRGLNIPIHDNFQNTQESNVAAQTGLPAALWMSAVLSD